MNRILEDAPPRDLPFEQASPIGLVINLDTARRFGLVLPPELLLRASRVVD